jgi:hypothetical protein
MLGLVYGEPVDVNDSVEVLGDDFRHFKQRCVIVHLDAQIPAVKSAVKSEVKRAW